MKNLFFILTLISLSLYTVESNAQSFLDGVIGTISNGATTITANTNTVRSGWAQLLNDREGIQVQFHSLEIIQDGNSYMLVASNSDRSINSGVELRTQGGDLVAAEFHGGHTTVTCSGCTLGCEPRKRLSGTGYLCTGCKFGGTCTKTVTTTF